MTLTPGHGPTDLIPRTCPEGFVPVTTKEAVLKKFNVSLVTLVARGRLTLPPWLAMSFLIRLVSAT